MMLVFVSAAALILIIVLLPRPLLIISYLQVGYIVLVLVSHEPRPISQDEACIDPNSPDDLFPCLVDTASDPDDKDEEDLVELSLIIPAYNETARLPGMLKTALDYLERRAKKQKSFTFEVIVVDDGSLDGTADLAREIAAKRYPKMTPVQRPVRVLQFAKNRGKGGAVTQGMLCARGKYLLFADADGATNFSDLETLIVEMSKSIIENPCSVVIGSRSHLVSTDAVVQRSFVRNFLMYSFHTVVYLLCVAGVRKIKDTQCGFKLFSRAAAQKIFPYMHVEGWIFDIELLQLAAEQGMLIKEVEVNWIEIPGSKMSLVKDSINMALDLLVIRLNYLIGRWRISSNRMPAVGAWRVETKKSQ